MKSKKTLLTICASGAMVFATIFTYAAWIKLSDTVESEVVTIAPGGVINGVQTGSITKTGFDGTENANSLKQITVFTISGVGNNAYDQITLASVIENSGTPIDPQHYTIVYTDITDNNPLTNGLDPSIDADGANSYSITVTPKSTTAAATAFTGNITIDTTGTLSKKTT